MADDDEGDDGEDGEDDGEEGDEDDEEGDGADGETGFVSRADSEIKSEPMDITSSQDEAGETAGTAPIQPSQELPLTNFNLPVPLPPSSHIEGSPLKQVVSALSPGAIDSDSAFQESPTKPSAVLDNVEQTLHTAESAPDPLPIVDTNTLPETSGTNTMPTADEDATEDLDTEMQDVAPLFTDVSTENMLSADAENSTITTDLQDSSIAQPVESSDPTPISLVDKEAGNQATDTEPHPENTEIEEASANPEIQTSENATEANVPADPPARESMDPLIEPSTAQATDVSSADEQPIPVPELTESQDEPSVPQTQEEVAANSPDLFSGLEAALNQHGHSSSSEPIPEKPEAAVSQPDAFQSD
ncbi:hypothetical protein F4680DRAFT_49342 [Xylaria scruposa]|nr:hypothetical protein F4680DRAFT_49342 [Xylaria scruposa]